MRSPAVSVLCAAYNAADTLADSLQSLLDQSFQDFEIVLVDDGSTDGSFSIAKGFAAKDSRIRVIRNASNLGLTKSLNIGFRHCRGEYVARHDADDISFPQRLLVQIKVARDEGADFLVARYTANEGIFPKYFRSYIKLRNMMFGNFLCHGTFFLRRSMLESIGGYDERFRYSQDAELLLRYLKGGGIVRLIRNPLYRFSSGAGRISEMRRNEQHECLMRAYSMHGLVLLGEQWPRPLRIAIRNLI